MNRSIVLRNLELADDLIRRVDGDRDHMNRSDLTCEQTIAVAEVIRAAISFLSKAA